MTPGRTTQGRYYPGNLRDCTCGGTEPGWNQHEDFCGQDVDGEFENNAKYPTERSDR